MADWTAHVSVTALARKTCRILGGKVAGKRPVGRQEDMNRWNYDRRGEFIVISEKWIELAQDRVKIGEITTDERNLLWFRRSG